MTAAVLAPIAEGDAVLRMLAPADLERTLAWRNHPDSRDWFHSTGEIAPGQHRAWFERYLERDDDYVFILEVGGRPVAQAALYGIADGGAEFGRLVVDPAARGEGHSHRAIALCLRAARELGLARVHLEVKPGNARAIAAYKRAGFEVDGGAVGRDGSVVMRRELG